MVLPKQMTEQLSIELDAKTDGHSMDRQTQDRTFVLFVLDISMYYIFPYISIMCRTRSQME